MVWMRTSGMSSFRKLWGRIETGLTPGTYTLVINNNYDVSDFGGKKTFVLSTANFFGGQNYFMSACFMVVGIMCVVFAVVLLCAFMNKKRLLRKQLAKSD